MSSIDLGTNSVCFPRNVCRHVSKIVKRDYSFVKYVCLSIRVEQLGSH